MKISKMFTILFKQVVKLPFKNLIVVKKMKIFKIFVVGSISGQDIDGALLAIAALVTHFIPKIWTQVFVVVIFG